MDIKNYEEKFILLNQELDKLKVINHDKVTPIFDEIKEEITNSERGANELKASNSILKIGVVGQVKAGKSSFLNSMA